MTLIMVDASGKNKQAEATQSKRPIPNSAVEDFKKIMVGGGVATYEPVLNKLMLKWWAQPQRGQFLVTQCASF